MAFYRNQYLDYTKKHFSDFDYLLVYDFDLNGGIYLDGLISNFDPRLDWDMVCATGLVSAPQLNILLGGESKPNMHDTIAFLDLNDNWYKKSEMRKEQILLNNKLKKIGSDLIPIRSGFNGMAIYKINSIKDTRYDFKTRCEHIDFHKNMFEKGFNKIFLSPNLLLYTVPQGPDITIHVAKDWLSGNI